MTNRYKKVMVRPEPDTLPPDTLPDANKEWTFGDAEREYNKRLAISDEYHWPIEDIDGEDWVPLWNAANTVMELCNKLETVRSRLMLAKRMIPTKDWENELKAHGWKEG